MGPLLGLLAAFLVACGFDAFIAKPMAMDGEDILGLSLCAAIATLLGSGLGDYLDTRRLQEPFNARLINALVLRNLLFAAVTGAFVATVVAYAGSTVPMSRAVAVQFAIVTALSGTVAYGELISRYRDTPGRLLSADPTVIYICVNIAAGTAALALVKDLHAVTSAEHKLVYETLLAGFGAIAFFRTSLFTIRVSGSDVGVGPSTLLKALLDSSDMMLNRWQALNRGAQVKIIMAGVDFAKAKAALPTMCFTLMNDFPAAVQSSVAEQIKKLADDTSMSDEAKVLILGIYLIQQVGTDVLDRAVRTLDTAIK
jgi:hypothetical protein